MGTELDQDQVIADYADGRPVEEIQAAYGLTRDEIEYLVAGEPKQVSGWSLQRKGNRIALAVLVGLVAAYFAGLLGGETIGRIFVWAIVGFVTYLIATHYAGRDSSR